MSLTHVRFHDRFSSAKCEKFLVKWTNAYAIRKSYVLREKISLRQGVEVSCTYCKTGNSIASPMCNHPYFAGKISHEVSPSWNKDLKSLVAMQLFCRRRVNFQPSLLHKRLKIYPAWGIFSRNLPPCHYHRLPPAESVVIVGGVLLEGSPKGLFCLEILSPFRKKWAIHPMRFSTLSTFSIKFLK